MSYDEIGSLYSQKDVQSSKYDLDDWEAFEVKLPPSEKEVIEMLKRCALQDGWKVVKEESDRVLSSCGDLYLTLREGVMVSLGLRSLEEDSDEDSEEEEKNKKEKKEKKGNKSNKKRGLTKDEIIAKATMGRVQKEIDDLTGRWKHLKGYVLPSIRAMDSVEAIVLSLIHHLRTSEQAMISEEIEEAELYEAVFGVSKILHQLKIMNVKDMGTGKLIPVHPQLLADLTTVYQRFCKKAKYDILVAAKKYPKLLLKTAYDSMLPGLAMAPYASQVQLIELLVRHQKQGLFACLNTLTGEGKTTLVVAIAQLAMTLSSHTKKYEVIYCCSEKLKTVRQQVGRYAYNGLIPFGVAVTNPKSDEVILTDSYNCKKMKHERVLTIADIVSTIHLLEMPPVEGHEYILFFDEPTVGLDQVDSPMMDYLYQVYSCMPKLTIFSTATAPERESIPLLEQLFLQNYPGAHVEFIKSTKVLIGSEIASLEGEIYLPHSSVDSSYFSAVLSRIEGNAFLQKCYTANVVYDMHQSLLLLSKKYGFTLNDVPSFKEYMGQPGNMNQPSIIRVALSYLRKVEKEGACHKGVVEEFCAPRGKKERVAFDRLAEKGEQFENQTLLVTADPLAFFDEHFVPYIQKAHEDIGLLRKSFAEIFLAYDEKRQEYEAKREAILEKKEKKGVGSKEEKDGIDHEMERQQKLSELVIPHLAIPERWIIGSAAYLKERRSAQVPRKLPSLEGIDWVRIHCEDRFAMGLALGVGIFSPSRMDLSYTRAVIELASNGLLAYILADDDICYGTNYPIENVIVDSTCLPRHSVKTMFQVFARAGRPGKSWKASIYADSTVLDIISQSMISTEANDMEVQNMNGALSLAMTKAMEKALSKTVQKTVEKTVEQVSIQPISKEDRIVKPLNEEKEKKEEIAESWEDM